VRHDVFAAMADPRPAVQERAAGWHAAVQGWVMAHPQVRTVNADITPVPFNKPAAQMAARRHGLRTPPTWVSNDTTRLLARLEAGSQAPTIAKPVAGGGLCQPLAAALLGVEAAHSAMPALIQPRLVAPELRVFVVGQQTLAFRVDSPSLDYCEQQDARVTPCAVPPEAEALRQLMAEFRMDFGAADFKTDPDTGELCFLELNTSPMFAHFDLVSDGAVCRALIQHLL
jgi:glutathione synthase/RimK-type ligase-like ATP-grasp enzyme